MCTHAHTTTDACTLVAAAGCPGHAQGTATQLKGLPISEKTSLPSREPGVSSGSPGREHVTGDIALFGVLHSEKGDKTNMKQRSPDQSTLPSPLKQAMARGSPSLPSVGQEALHQPQGLAGRAQQRREGSSCHSARRSSPGNIYNFTYSASPA